MDKKTVAVAATFYSDVHKWMRKNFGSADRCEGKECKGTSKRYHWALLKGKQYAKIRENFWRLCSSCHAVYDSTPEGRKSGALKRTGKSRPYLFKPVVLLDSKDEFVTAYLSVKDTCKALGVSHAVVSNAIRRGYRVRGYKPRYCEITYQTS